MSISFFVCQRSPAECVITHAFHQLGTLHGCWQGLVPPVQPFADLKTLSGSQRTMRCLEKKTKDVVISIIGETVKEFERLSELCLAVPSSPLSISCHSSARQPLRPFFP